MVSIVNYKFLPALIGFGTIINVLFAANPSTAYTINRIETDTTGFKDIIGEFQQFVQKERLEISNPNAYRLDPSKLKLATDSNVRIFFLNEGATKRENQLKFTTSDNTQPSASIFGNISCSDPKCIIRENSGNLRIGDWVDLGFFRSGTTFDFILESRNNNDGQIDIYGTNPATNPDGLDHVVAYQYKDYVVFGFENLFGQKGATGGRNEASDRDFNDSVFAIKLPAVNQSQPVPEGSSILSILAVSAVSIGLRRKFKQKATLNF